MQRGGRSTRLWQAALVAGGLVACDGAAGPDQLRDVNQSGAVPEASFARASGTTGLFYQVIAKNARVNREVTGPVEESVEGIPARPVDSFTWDGIGSTPIRNAIAQVRVDPIANQGTVTASWSDNLGHWTYHQEMFMPPDHPTGTRIGPDVGGTVNDIADPITTNVYLHGNTGSGGPVLPTIFNLLATWGPAEVRLNGELIENPFDGPAPRWVGHSMTTLGARGRDGTVRTTGGDIFNMMTTAADGAVDNNDMEFHLVFHDRDQPMVPGNIPPIFDFFYHLVFEDVEVRISHGEERL